MSPIIKLRQAQKEFVRGVDRYGVTALSARRQYGKTTIFANIAMMKMMRKTNHTVVFGSAKLNLSREVVRKEAEIMQTAVAAVMKDYSSEQMRIINSENGKQVPTQLSPDDFAELFEAQRLEFRYYHDRGVYSRTKVVALRPDTVGETGDLMCDEVGRINNWQEVWEAVEPIVSSNPDFRVTFATTPPTDDSHHSFVMLAPPLGMDFPINPKGNWYRTELGIWVLRVSAYDAYADGVPVYDLETREALTPEEHRRRASDKDAWDRNYGVKFLVGGTGAVGLLALDSAQRRGVGKCACIVVTEDSDFDTAIEFLRNRIGSGEVGIGVDLATTEKGHSNPTSLTVMEKEGVDFANRLTIVWKTSDPAIARERFTRVIDTIDQRKEGGRVRAMCIDATNERYFSVQLQRDLASRLPVHLIINSETLEIPGQKEKITVKAHLGNQFIELIDSNRYVCPPEKYLKEDYRRVKRFKGTFDTELGPNGEHGDTFDSGKLALHALERKGNAIQTTEGIYVPKPTFSPTHLLAGSIRAMVNGWKALGGSINVRTGQSATWGGKIERRRHGANGTGYHFAFDLPKITPFQAGGVA